MSEIRKVMQITLEDAEVVLDLAAEYEFEIGLDDKHRDFVDKVIEAFPSIDVPGLLK